MDHGPLVIDEIKAGADLVKAFHDMERLKAAFWLKENEDDYRYLFLVLSEPADGKKRSKYSLLSRIDQSQTLSPIDPFRVKIIDGNDPLAQAAIEFAKTYPQACGTRRYGGPFANKYIEDLYIYSPNVLEQGQGALLAVPTH